MPSSFLNILLTASGWTENNWKGKGNSSCQPGEGRLMRFTSLGGVPGSVLGKCHTSYVTAHMSSLQMRAPGWGRDSALGLPGILSA